MLDSFLSREIDVGSFPSATYAIGTSDGIVRTNALGHAVAVPLRIQAATDTIYDCASTTKVLVTTILILQAVAEGRISLDDEYRGYTFRELLTHTSGLRAWLPTFTYPSVMEAIERDGPEAPRGSRVMYSDLNFYLLYFALNEIFGDYRRAAHERIFEPLQLRDAYFDPPQSLKPRIAATEWGQRFEPRAFSVVGFAGFRQGLMWGEPNDGNSFHAGGTLGNAGLFATAADTYRIMQGFVRGELVSRELIEEATRTHAPGRGLGFALEGPGLSPRSFGHMGFTGTSVWVDGSMIFVLMTNRVHPCAAPIGMHSIRGEFHRLSSQALSS
ncbi:MAG TPA: serine hydrolase domain-containing protein [Thermoanaerobaculia bacterium]|nr:serine hydrolase domain-containing protein [Thermoanaerobaculia bacterium]